MMAQRGMWPAKWRSVGLIGAGVALGTTLVTPAAAQIGAADVTEEMKHFWKDYIKRQVIKLGDLRWLGIAAKAADADKLDGIDSTGFAPGVLGKAVDADRLDGIDSAGFAAGIAGKAVDSDLLDGLNSSAFLGVNATAANADKLDNLNSTDFLRTTGTAANSQLLDNLDSTDFLRANATAVNAEKLDNLDSTAFQRNCMDGAVRAFGIIDGRHDDLTLDGPFVTTPVSRGFNCNGLAIQVRRTPGMVEGSGDYQVDFGVSSSRGGCEALVVQLTPGPGADAGDDNIVNYVRTASVRSGELGVDDCYVEVQVRNDGGGAEDGVFIVTRYR